MKVCLVVSPFSYAVNSRKLSTRISNLVKFFNGTLCGQFEGSWPPLGLLYMATLIKNNGYEVAILDTSMRGTNPKQIIDWLKKENPDVVEILKGFPTSSNPKYNQA